MSPGGFLDMEVRTTIDSGWLPRDDMSKGES